MFYRNKYRIKRAIGWTATAALAATLWTSPAVANQVQAPSVARPERGSVAGAYAGTAFAAGEMSRGSFSLPLPLKLPTFRGRPLVNVFPKYSPDGGITEWGLGWSASVSIRRFSATTDLAYDGSDQLVGPWGRMLQGTDGGWYVNGLQTGVRVVEVGDELVAHQPDGTIWRFGGSERLTTARGVYEWYLTEVQTLRGDTTTVTYVSNGSGRRFVSNVSYGGLGTDREYSFDISYVAVPTPFTDWRSGEPVDLDRRVSDITMNARNSNSDALELRWTYDLAYDEDPWGPAFYLTSIQREFASGELEEPVTYGYSFGADELQQANFRPVPDLSPVLFMFGNDAIQPDRSAKLDVDRDGRLDMEHHERYTLLVHTDTGFETQELGPAPADVYTPCRLPDSPFNQPRNLARLHNNDTVPRVVVTEPNYWFFSTTLSVCNRGGQRIDTESLPGLWSLGPNTRLVDVNRDHKADFVRVNYGSYEIIPNESAYDAAAQTTDYRFGTKVQGTLSPSVSMQESWIYDFNGDSVPDLVVRDGSSMVSWYGTGNFQFNSIGESFMVLDRLGLPVSMQGFNTHFVDANKDGLTDLLLTQSNVFRLFVNDGYVLHEKAIPALQSLDFSVSEPVIADLAASGNAEIAITRGSAPESLQLVSSNTGLMASADDGRGTVLSFSYERGPAYPDIEYRSSVVGSMTSQSSGYDTVTYDYDYQHPVPHSEAKYLIGFNVASREAPHTTETAYFHNDDHIAGLKLRIETTDDRTPGLYRFTETEFEEDVFRGLRWMRRLAERSGVSSSDGMEVVATETRFEQYTDLCVTEMETDIDGKTLRQVTTLADVPALHSGLYCLAATQTTSGIHSDPALDFSNGHRITYNALGLKTTVEAVAQSGATQVLQQIAYDGLNRPISVSNPGRGATTAQYLGDTDVAVSVTSPDGIVTTIADLDPVRDTVREIAVDRAGDVYREWFRHDDRERLHKTWASFGGSSEVAPAEQIDYRYATANHPAWVSVRALVDDQNGVFFDELSWQTASGENLASARSIPDGWMIHDLVRTDRNALEQRGYDRDAVGIATDVYNMDYTDLMQGAVELSMSRSAAFGHEVAGTGIMQSGVQQTRGGGISLSGGQLIATRIENGAHTTRVGQDANGNQLWSEDENNVQTHYSYDAMNRLVSVTLPNGDQQQVSFDEFGRPSALSRDGIATFTYHYDATTGLLVEKRIYDAQDVLERTVMYTHDSIGRVIAEDYILASSGAVQSYTYTYSSAPGQLGFLTSVVGDGFRRDVTYQPDGAIDTAIVTFPGWRAVKLAYDYYANGEPRSITRTVSDDSGNIIEIVVHGVVVGAHGRVDRMTLNGTTLVTMVYDSQGKIDRADFANGESIDYSYDSATKSLSGYLHTSGLWTAGESWTVDARGHVVRESIQNGASVWDRDYTYDARGFLVESQDADHLATYSYDSAGLPEVIDDLAGQRSVNHHGAASIDVAGVIYEFDSMGRVIRKGDLDLEYGPNGQLAVARRGMDEWHYYYDEAGHRLLKTESGYPIAAYLGGSYMDDTAFIEPFKVREQLIGAIENGQFIALATDPRGSVLADTDGTVNLPTPYGMRASRPDMAEALDYVQKAYDADLDVVRMGERDYDATLGTFWTPDRLFLENIQSCVESPMECNLYSYALNNPISFVDPMGTSGQAVNINEVKGPIKDGTKVKKFHVTMHDRVTGIEKPADGAAKAVARMAQKRISFETGFKLGVFSSWTSMRTGVKPPPLNRAELEDRLRQLGNDYQGQQSLQNGAVLSFFVLDGTYHSEQVNLDTGHSSNTHETSQSYSRERTLESKATTKLSLESGPLTGEVGTELTATDKRTHTSERKSAMTHGSGSAYNTRRGYIRGTLMMRIHYPQARGRWQTTINLGRVNVFHDMGGANR